MKRYIRLAKLWLIERAESGTAWDLFLLGLVGLLALIVTSMFIYYV